MGLGDGEKKKKKERERERERVCVGGRCCEYLHVLLPMLSVLHVSQQSRSYCPTACRRN